MDDLIKMEFNIEYEGNDSQLVEEIKNTITSRQKNPKFDVKIIRIQPNESKKYDISENTSWWSGDISIGIPMGLIDTTYSGIANLLIFAVGDLFANKNFKKIRTKDIDLPKTLLEIYTGPKFGIDGIREKLNNNGPIFASLIHPKYGLSAKKYGQIAKDLLENGADMVMDDQYCVSNDTCPIYEKADAVFSNLKDVIKKDGPKLYSINITSGKNLIDTYHKIQEIASKYNVEDNIVMAFNGITGGFTGLEILSDISDKPIQVHVGSHGLLTRHSDYSISMHILCKLFRLIGGDFINAGHIAEKKVWYYSDSEVIYNNYDTLRGKFDNIKPSFPVAAGGLDPLSIEQNVKILGNDTVFQIGGFVFSDPFDYNRGIKCIRQTFDYINQGYDLSNLNLNDETKKYPELKTYLESRQEKNSI